MIINSSLTRLSVALIAAMGLSACHDHHHNSNNNDDGEVAVEVQVLDGALKGALVFADLNRNFELDREEAYVNTDEKGRATLYIPKSSLKDSAGNDINSFRLFARSGDISCFPAAPKNIPSLKEPLLYRAASFFRSFSPEPENLFSKSPS